MDGFLANTCTRTVSYENVVGILTIECFVADFVGFDFAVFPLKFFVEYFLTVCFQFQRSDDMMIPVFLFTGQCPIARYFFDFFICPSRRIVRKDYFFHHLTDHAIGQYHSRITIFKSQLETQYDKITHFLNRCGGKNDQVIITVSTTFGRLKVVTL